MSSLSILKQYLKESESIVIIREFTTKETSEFIKKYKFHGSDQVMISHNLKPKDIKGFGLFIDNIMKGGSLINENSHIFLDKFSSKELEVDAELMLIVIDKDIRNQGYGKLLIQESIKNYNTVYLMTLHPIVSDNALKIYETLGFRIVREDDNEKYWVKGPVKFKKIEQKISTTKVPYKKYFDDIDITPVNFNKKTKLFHISKKELRVLHADRPDNFFTKTGNEENITSRISMAPDVDHCIVSLGYKVENKEFFVYEPLEYDHLKVVHNDFLVKHRLVPDADITKEVWILNSSIIVKKIGKIKVYSSIDKHKEVKFIVDGKIKTEKTFFWKWGWIEK